MGPFITALGGDGVTEALFHRLWEKDDLNIGLAVAIPDTIIIRHGKPQCWYFTAVDGKIKRKNKKKVHVEQIEHTFVTKSVGYDVVGTFIGTRSQPDNPSSRNAVHLFDARQLHDFLSSPDRLVHGILQKFMEPKGTRNEVIRAIWSPKVCLLDKKENIHYLHDTRMGIYERVMTYEGPEYYSRPAPLRGSGISSELQRICDTVVSHIAEVSYQEECITRCVLHFKVDSRDRAWLLFSTSMRLSSNPSEGPINMDGVLHIPDNVILKPEPSHSRDEGHRDMSKQQENCIACSKLVLSAHLYPVTYKVVIDFYENVTQVLDDREGHRPSKHGTSRSRDRGDKQIPTILRAVHPRLTVKLFQKFRRDPVFLYRTCSICETCFLEHAEYANTSLVVGPSLSSFVKPGNHIPSTTRSRRQQDEQAWKSLSAFHKRSLSPKEKPAPAHSSTVQSRTSPELIRPPPEFPGSITTSTEFRQSMQYDYDPGLLASTPNVDVQSMIAEREQQYFNELAKNKHAQTHHPLTHLITTQRKLLATDQQTGLQRSPGMGGGEIQSAWFANYGSQPKKDSLNAYTTTLSAVVPNKHVERSQRQKNRKKKSVTNLSSSTNVSLSETATSHQKFLQQTLQQFQKEGT